MFDLTKLGFHRSQVTDHKPRGELEELAKKLISDRGPTSEQIKAAKLALGWQEHALGGDAKLNHRAQQLIKRHVKRLSPDGQISRNARRRIEEYFPLNKETIAHHKSAKSAVAQAPELRLKVAELEDRLADSERERLASIEERDSLREQKLKFREAFGLFLDSSDSASVMQEGSLRQGRRPSRSLRARPQSAYNPTMAPLLDELTTREHAQGTIQMDVAMGEPGHAGA